MIGIPSYSATTPTPRSASMSAAAPRSRQCTTATGSGEARNTGDAFNVISITPSVLRTASASWKNSPITSLPVPAGRGGRAPYAVPSGARPPAARQFVVFVAGVGVRTCANHSRRLLPPQPFDREQQGTTVHQKAASSPRSPARCGRARPRPSSLFAPRSPSAPQNIGSRATANLPRPPSPRSLRRCLAELSNTRKGSVRLARPPAGCSRASPNSRRRYSQRREVGHAPHDMPRFGGDMAVATRPGHGKAIRRDLMTRGKVLSTGPIAFLEKTCENPTCPRQNPLKRLAVGNDSNRPQTT